MWHQGYTSELDYTYGYYNELSPTRIKLALLACGIDHSISDNPNYLELGFGQGLSLNINAATSSGSFYGTDFNPGQVANAQVLADSMNKQITLLEDSFEELAARDDLPRFDIIALHGIWSWISDNARKAIVDIALRHLRPGGALYLSYNVTPGWSPGIPLRILMAEYAKREMAGALVDKINGSLDFVTQVMDAGAGYFAQNPVLRQRLDQIKTQDRNYLAHEYYNADWHPMPFSRVADELAQAKLTYAANASILENLSGISLPASALPILQAIRDPVMRETTRDYFVNTQFRRDIFVKGPRGLSVYEHGQRVEQTRFVLLGDPEKRPEKVTTVIGEAQLLPEVHAPVVAALARAPNCTASIGELMADKELASLNRIQLWEVMLILTGAGYVAPTASSTTPEEDFAASRSLNTALLRRAEPGTGVDYLAAPNLGAAIQVARIDQLFIKALSEGQKDPVEWVLGLLRGQGQFLIVEGKQIEGEDENRTELKRMYAEFEKLRQPVLQRIGVL